MRCPFCQTEDTKVIDSRLVGDGFQVRRRRACIVCEERFTSYETAELLMPYVIKNDGERVPFDQKKLRAGFVKALEKRPIAVEAIDLRVNRVLHNIRRKGEREVASKLIGELVIEELKTLDHVAYVRFASIYRSFQDVDAFSREIEKLNQEQTDAAKS